MNLGVPWLYKQKKQGRVRMNKQALLVGVLLAVFAAGARYLGMKGGSTPWWFS
jgi:hypothetical protein